MKVILKPQCTLESLEGTFKMHLASCNQDVDSCPSSPTVTPPEVQGSVDTGNGQGCE